MGGKGSRQDIRRKGWSGRQAGGAVHIKGTGGVPGKADKKKQETFVKTYKRWYKKLSEEEKIYFMDGSHPTFNNRIGYGWMRKGAGLR
jgi:hypothetical protein